MAKILLCPSHLLETNLSGKTYIVTGGNSGIGLVTVEQLSRQGARVILACRRPEQGRRAVEEIKKRGTTVSIDLMEIDLSDLDSVRSFVAAFDKLNLSLHGLVNNAGVMNTPNGKTRQGYEIQFGTNHLGHYLLTELLLPNLQKNSPSRVVNLSSCFHDKAMGKEGRIDFEDLHFERRKYDGWVAYGQSKLANLLHAKQLAKRLKGSGVTTVSVHPGWVRTNLIRQSMPVWLQDVLLKPIFKLAGMIEPWEGVQSTLYALLAPEVEKHNGAYFSQVGIYRDKEATKGGWPLKSPNPHAHDDDAAERLDEISRKLVGLK